MTQLPPRAVLLVAALLAAAALALLAAPGAAAGIFTAVQCHEPIGAGHADAKFAATSRRYVASADCGGRGLGVVHAAGRGRTESGRYGAWTLTAPPGTEVLRARARVAAAGDDWHTPQLSLVLADGVHTRLEPVRGDRHAVRWSGRKGRALVARLVCSNPRGCGPGPDAHIHLRRIAFGLRDTTTPELGLAGSLLDPGSRRGPQGLIVTGRDSGSGVRTVTIEANGEPLAASVVDCALAGSVAVRLRPCPASTTVPFDLATASAHFAQGPNRVRVCVADYAPRAAANRACALRTVRVDNLCPVSAVAGSVIRAGFSGASRRTVTRGDRAARVVGRLLSESGQPVTGARVCVAVRTRAPGETEGVLATPMTDADGAFAVRIPPGPNRQVRIAHWPDSDRALERFLELRARAVPRLRLRPDRVLENGDRVRFCVRIPGPRSAGRRVRIEARAGRHWLTIDRGRTSSSGAWRGRYRFHATTGTQRYAFRAVVPAQAGYPYERGRSRTRRATVTGGTAPPSRRPLRANVG